MARPQNGNKYRYSRSISNFDFARLGTAAQPLRNRAGEIPRNVCAGKNPASWQCPAGVAGDVHARQPGNGGPARRFSGNYSAYVAQRETEIAAQAREWKVQEEYVARVKSDVSRLKGEALNIERNTTAREPGVRKFAKRKAAIAKAREHKLDRFLASDERVEKPTRSWSVHLDFGAPPETGRAAFRLSDVAAAYPAGPALFAGVSFEIQHGDRVAIVGPNGSGKTTLLRILDGHLAPVAGERWVSASVKMGTLTQEQESLDHSITVIESVRRARMMGETEARSFLHLFLFGGDSVFRRVADCSPGERTRLQLAVLVLRGCNVLILDEPLNHLDIDGREHFEAALKEFVGTVIAVAHDRRFLASFAERVVHVGSGGAVMREGGFDS